MTLLKKLVENKTFYLLLISYLSVFFICCALLIPILRFPENRNTYLIVYYIFSYIFIFISPVLSRYFKRIKVNPFYIQPILLINMLFLFTPTLLPMFLLKQEELPVIHELWEWKHLFLLQGAFCYISVMLTYIPFLAKAKSKTSEG